MAVQATQNNITVPFSRDGEAFVKDNEVVLTNGARSGAMAPYTLMAQNPTTQKWVPFTDNTATDGTQWPRGILLINLTEAQIKAADVVDVPILVGGRGLVVDKNQLVIENSKLLTTVINVPTNSNKTVETCLREIGIFMQDTVDIDAYQQA
jgi:hypothetical protein